MLRYKSLVQCAHASLCQQLLSEHTEAQRPSEEPGWPRQYDACAHYSSAEREKHDVLLPLHTHSKASLSVTLASHKR